MNIQQLDVLRANGKKFFTILTTRNGAYTIDTSDDADLSKRNRYTIEEWDDANELLVLSNNRATVGGDSNARMTYINYAIIDEVEMI